MKYEQKQVSLNVRHDINKMDGQTWPLNRITTVGDRKKMVIATDILGQMVACLAPHSNEVAWCAYIDTDPDGILRPIYFDLVKVSDSLGGQAYVEAEDEYLEAGVRSIRALNGHSFNCWGHTHPGFGPNPSGTDNDGWGKVVHYNQTVGVGFTNYFMIYSPAHPSSGMFYGCEVIHHFQADQTILHELDIHLEYQGTEHLVSNKSYGLNWKSTWKGFSQKFYEDDLVEFLYKGQTMRGRVVGPSTSKSKQYDYDVLCADSQIFYVPQGIMTLIHREKYDVQYGSLYDDWGWE